MDIEKELSELTPEEQSSFAGDIDDDLLMFEKSSKRKKEKKERKLKKREKDIFGFIDDDDDEEESLDFLVHKKVKNKKEDIFDTSGKKPKEENYESKFKAEQAQLERVLKDADKVFSDTREIFNEIKSSKARGTSKILTDLIAGLNSANTARLQVIKEKSNIKKIISDLKLKNKSLKKNELDGDATNEEFGARYLSELYNLGRNNAIDAINTAQSSGYDPELINVPLTINDGDSEYYIDENASLDDVINNRLNNQSVRSKEADLYIKYEKYKPEICISKSLYGEDIDIFAVDKDGNPMPDEYPVPDISELGKLTFNYDSKTVSDSKGRIYRLILLDE